ncbi:hypothetical protein V1478_010930 [Vespula squamosa]|uniref:Uncharacterized protein n=1 Tax=Vespula squamosa TaxID=30214 RepID=A0ABD2AFS6_VESSQ
MRMNRVSYLVGSSVTLKKCSESSRSKVSYRLLSNEEILTTKLPLRRRAHIVERERLKENERKEEVEGEGEREGEGKEEEENLKEERSSGVEKEIFSWDIVSLGRNFPLAYLT